MFGQQSLFGGAQANQQQNQPQPTQQQPSGFSLFNKPNTAPTGTLNQSSLNLTNTNNQQSAATQSLFGQQQQQNQQTSNQPNLNLGTNPTGTSFNPSFNPNANVPTNKQNLDFFHSKLSTQKVSKESQDEIYSKLVKQYSDFSKSNNLKGHLQLESLDLNLDMLDQMILPDYLKFKKNLFQLVALSENNKKDISAKTTNINNLEKAQAFLTDNGINIAKLDKDVNEIKNYLISNYEFISKDLNKINLGSDKTILDNRTKMHLSVTTNALWAKTNDNIIFCDNFTRLRKKDLNYYNKIAKLQFAELEGLFNFGASARDYLSASSNAQSANKFVQGGSTNKFLFGRSVSKNQSAGKFNEANLNRNKIISERSSANFTPLKPMSLNSAAKGNFGFGIGSYNINNTIPNKYKNVNNLSSSNVYDFSDKHKTFSTLDYIDNLRMINHQNVGIGAADETQVYQFTNYFENLKSYFYYKLYSEVIVENQPLLITNSDLEAFYALAKDEKHKNNILPMSICINKLINYFEYSKDFSRKSIFSLIFSQIKCSNKSWKNSILTGENLIANTIKYYESEFLKRIISQSDLTFAKNASKSEAEIYNLEYDLKFNCVEKFATNFIFQNFSNLKSQNASNYNSYMNPNYNNYNGNLNAYSKNDLEKMKKWAIIYVFLRAGLVKDCFIYLSNLIKLGYEEDLSANNFANFGNNIDNYDIANRIYAGNQNLKDQDLEIFFSLMKQVYSENSDIDLNLYSMLSEKIKLKNLKDAEPFKFCCFNLILKINQPVNENIFLSFEDYIWYHLSLIHKKANFLKLINTISFKLNYLSLDEFQEFILNNDPNIFNSKNNPDFILEYAKSLFSLLLFEEGIKLLLESNKNIIDAFNIGFILKELNLLHNFSEEDIAMELTEFRHKQNLNLIKDQINSFANKIGDKRKIFEILIYIKFLFLDEEVQKTIDLFNITINRFGNFKFLLDANNAFIEIEDVSL